MEEFAVGDLHLTYPWEDYQYERIWTFLSLVPPKSKVVFAGDIVELVWFTHDEVVQDERFQRFIKIIGDSDWDKGFEWGTMTLIFG